MSVVRSLSVGLSRSQASSQGFHGQYVTLTAGHTTYPARLLLHKSFKDSVTIINKGKDSCNFLCSAVVSLWMAFL